MVFKQFKESGAWPVSMVCLSLGLSANTVQAWLKVKNSDGEAAFGFLDALKGHAPGKKMRFTERDNYRLWIVRELLRFGVSIQEAAVISGDGSVLKPEGRALLYYGDERYVFRDEYRLTNVRHLGNLPGCSFLILLLDDLAVESLLNFPGGYGASFEDGRYVVRTGGKVMPLEDLFFKDEMGQIVESLDDDEA